MSPTITGALLGAILAVSIILFGFWGFLLVALFMGIGALLVQRTQLLHLAAVRVERLLQLARVLRPVADEYDVILIDCQPSLGLLTVNALTASHGVIIPLECEFFAMRGVALLVETIDKVTDRLNPRLEIDGILATMYDGRTLHSRDVVRSVVDHFGDKVFHTVISRTVKFPDATLAAEPITQYASGHGAAESYRQLARELISRGGAP